MEVKKCDLCQKEVKELIPLQDWCKTKARKEACRKCLKPLDEKSTDLEAKLLKRARKARERIMNRVLEI